MSRFTRWLDRRFYPGVESNWDDTIFREAILPLLTPDFRLLDLGAGSGRIRQMNFRGLVRRVCGVDPDPRVTTNPHLDDGRQGYGEHLPFGDGEFDIVIADNVLEHLAVPLAVFREVHRVLKPGGLFVAKTPNRNHYILLMARSLPLWFHKMYNRLRGRAVEDTFPTHYRANSLRQLERLAQHAGFVLQKITFYESRPEYLRFSALTYLPAIVFERIINSSAHLSQLRIVFIVQLRKRQA